MNSDLRPRIPFARSLVIAVTLVVRDIAPKSISATRGVLPGFDLCLLQFPPGTTELVVILFQKFYDLGLVHKTLVLTAAHDVMTYDFIVHPTPINNNHHLHSAHFSSPCESFQ